MSNLIECFAVIFTSQRTANDPEGYAQMADRMEALAANESGFLGIESVRDQDGAGITISYWADEASIRKWKCNVDHLEAQALGKSEWYAHYDVKIAKVMRHYRSDSASKL